MNLRLILAALSFCIAMAGCVFANLAYYTMVNAINETKPRNKELAYFGFGTRLMFFDVLNEYRTLHPQSGLQMRLRLGFITMFVGLAATAGCLMLRFQ
jgi:hypothetical protein